MENQKTYVIRKIAYLYNDEYFYFHTLGGIERIFEDKLDAEQHLIALERAALEGMDLSSIEQLSSDRFYKEKKWLKKFCKDELGVDIIKVHENGDIFLERDFYFLKGLTDNQIKSIRNTAGIKFYELVEFTGIPKFFGLWKKKPFFEEERFFGGIKAPFFYNSYTEAVKASKKYLERAFNGIKLEGTLNQISVTPFLLESFIESCDSRKIVYNQEKKNLHIGSLSEDEAIALNELLIQKPLEIKEMDLDFVKNIEHWYYQQM